MSTNEQINDIIDALTDIKEDNTVPKNVRAKIDSMIKVLQDKNTDMSIKISKIQQELDEISEDTNLQAYTRTQIWNVSSILETI